ncbi:unnamed protein product [Candida verbasci]|uniref:F-box domain-containing protein n=1 Tax=Candida verbasci TaxID=1227364 RepID=A0A9W4U201_9ASCO|nr:unnamed protein product [Candida verbasci]
MTLSLLDLGEDILLQLSTHLTPSQIFKLFTLNKQLYSIFSHSNSIYNLLYRKLFNTTYPITSTQNWKEIFYTRVSSQQVFTWGESNGGRLGYLSTSIPQESLIRNFGWYVHTPSHIPEFDNFIIIDILATGFNFIFLLDNGEIWYSGIARNGYRNISPGPKEKDYIGRIENDHVAARRNLGVIPMPLMSQRYQIPKDEENNDLKWRQKSKTVPSNNNFLSKFEIMGHPHVVSISCGREHLIALTDTNELYTWDSGNSNKIGIKLTFPSIDSSYTILKICAGWNSSAILVENVGLVIIYRREALTKEQFENHHFTTDAKYIILPNSKNNIVDLTVGNNYILYISKSDNSLCMFTFNPDNLSSETSITELRSSIKKLDKFNNWKTQFEKHIEFTKVSSNFNNFIIFTNHDQILFGHSEDVENIIVHDELQGRNIVSIEIGDYHYLALTSSGDIFSWGIESKCCGCLGLGSKEEVKQKVTDETIVIDEGNGLRVTKPLIVKKPGNGKWIGIAAGGWHSAGIFVPDEPKKEQESDKSEA